MMVSVVEGIRVGMSQQPEGSSLEKRYLLSQTCCPFEVKQRQADDRSGLYLMVETMFRSYLVYSFLRKGLRFGGPS